MVGLPQPGAWPASPTAITARASSKIARMVRPRQAGRRRLLHEIEAGGAAHADRGAPRSHQEGRGEGARRGTCSSTAFRPRLTRATAAELPGVENRCRRPRLWHGRRPRRPLSHRADARQQHLFPPHPPHSQHQPGRLVLDRALVSREHGRLQRRRPAASTGPGSPPRTTRTCSPSGEPPCRRPRTWNARTANGASSASSSRRRRSRMACWPSCSITPTASSRSPDLSMKPISDPQNDWLTSFLEGGLEAP